MSHTIRVTDRDSVENALRKRERELAEAQRVGQLGSWEWDVAADSTSWSDELYRIFGLTPEELKPTFEGFLAHVHPEDRALINEAVGAALRGEELDLICRFIRPVGEVGWIHSRGEVIRDEAGVPLLMRGTALDVTVSKRTEEALQDTAARYRLLGTMAAAANEAQAVEEALQVAVDEVCAYAGWAAGHVYVRSDNVADRLEPVAIWHLKEPERLAALATAVEAAQTAPGAGLAGRVLATNMPAWTDDLSSAGMSAGDLAAELGLGAVLCFPVAVESRVAYVLEFFSDHLVEPDAALLETIGQVGTQLSRVVERQRAALELAAARDAALESSRLKSEFLATMSHEIRTPMNGVIGLTGLLLDTELDARQRQYAEGIHTAGEALMAIINDILDFSKIEAGKLDLELTDFELVQVLEEVAGLVAEPAERKGLELVAYCYPDLPTALRGDPSRLRQVLLNLASNAVKFTEKGEVAIRARLAPGPEAADAPVAVRFEVTDTGIGVAEDDRQRLFEPFSQADASTTRRFGGTGLGLAISHRLVTSMGGRIGFHSEPGRGSTFWFTLSLDRPVDNAVAPARPSRHLLEGTRVLVVDDNDTNGMILRQQLEAWDMIPEVTTDGPSALRRLRDAAANGQPFALALLDMCMPEMDGLELARHISADPGLKGIHLVLLTSASGVSPEDVRQAGIASGLTKPIRLSQLYDILIRIAAPPPTAANPRSASAALTVHRAGGRGRILVAEDNTTNKMVAVGILDQLGYRSDVAANGLETLVAMERTEYAAVLMDCQMPEMDGYAATGEVRRREGGSRHTPIIAMTAGAIDGDRERCLAAGMDDYISKPVKPEKLAAVLARWVGEAPHDPTPVAATEPEGHDDAASEALIDNHQLDVLRRVGLGSGALLAEVVNVFLADAQTDLTVLGEAARDGDHVRIALTAHRLRGAAANLGAIRVATLCSQLEQLGLERSLEDAPRLLARLTTEVDRAGDALRDTLAESSP
jgi:two-component system, sensor histidine kinase and response regulator